MLGKVWEALWEKSPILPLLAMTILHFFLEGIVTGRREGDEVM